ncbi:hypothetical protein ODY58_05675 [Aerococcus sp. JJEM-2022b]|uniref:LuxE/PaaK family acyltransferase n=1 Tax=Aerococcus mictus TaxID=2976810 RepID=UPI00227B5F56|nr:hypothetical protein [Aerococcus mictus]MCY3078448.1 hypothetical protein [Aerococcus mictus]
MKKIIKHFIEHPEEKENFKDVALLLFEYLYKHNQDYQQFCQRRAVGIRQVGHWKDIPAVSTDAFKNAFLSATPHEQCSRIFMTSGTTTGVSGKHYHKDLEIYDLSALLGFKQYVTDQCLPTAILFPNEKEMPNSSLAHYLEILKANGQPDSMHFITEKGLEVAALKEWLIAHQKQPVIILGASYSFVHLFEALSQGEVLPIHPDSLLFDTGGFKNFSKVYQLDTFYQKLLSVFPVRTNPVNMYGMTELSTEYYTQFAFDKLLLKRGPHWIKYKNIDPATGVEVEQGKPGLLVHIDLANINSVPAIQTGDLAIDHGEGFELLGRVKNGEPKGCSIAAKDWLEGHHD